MFRNFVKPSHIERLNTRERNGPYEHTMDHVRLGTETKEDIASKSVSKNTTTETRCGHSAPKDVRTLQPKSKNKASINTGASNSPPIQSNGTSSKQKTVTNTLDNINQNHASIEMNNPEALPQSKSLQPKNKQSHPTTTNHYDAHKTVLSNTRTINNNEKRNSIGDGNSNRCNPFVQVVISQHSDAVLNNSTITINSSETKNTTATLPTKRPDEPIPNKPTKQTLYTQEKFNVVPLPPPLVEPAFAGRRDVRHPSLVREKQIVSMKGTVRGFKNRVRAGIATFWAESENKRNYRHLEQGRIVVYATSMSVVRETDERCKSVRRLLQNHMVRYEERDLYMSRDIQQELSQRLSSEGIKMIRLPHVFADGIHIGEADDLEKLNEAGELRGILDNYQKVIVRIMCKKCGGYRFLPCEFCHGSKKSLIRNHFTEEFCALRCMHCDENGLRRCDLCADQQE